MKRLQHFICAFVVAGLVCLSLADEVQAQTTPQATAPVSPKVGDRIGDLVLNCQALAASQTACALNQTIVEAKSKKPILQLALRKLGKEQNLALVVNVPLGVYLASGIGGKVDDGKQFGLIWQSCTKSGCQAALGLDDATREALEKGKKLLIGFKTRPDSKTITVAASLKGVTAGLKALDVDN